MNTNRVRLLITVIVLILLCALPAFASNIRIVRLSLVQGDVQIDRNTGDGWEQAINNMPVVAGARIYAAESSKAELEFEDGSSLRLIGPAQVTMLNLSLAADGSRHNEVQVDSGQVYVNARLSKHDTFRLLAPSGEVFALSKSSRLRFTVDEQTASLAMLSGEATVEEGAKAAKVRSGETYNYVLGQPESAARQESVQPQPADEWNHQRDVYNEQNAAAGAQYSGEEGYAPGAADLATYGQYADVPGYGMMWQPYGVGLDWNPYGYGAWSYYPGWGWTFVSGYPWGWTPFFFGDWCYVNGRGWWWRPGHGPGRPGHGPGWHPRPRFVNAPAEGWRMPHPPNRISRGTVAVAGSHLNVGSINATHGGSVPGSRNGFVDVPRPGAVSRPGIASGAVARPPIAQGTSALHPNLVRGNSNVVIQRGTGTVRGPQGVVTGPQGVVRGPQGVVSGPQTAVRPSTGAVVPSTPRPAPSAPVVRPSSPSPAATPHVSSPPPAVHSAPSGGGFHGGSGFSGHAGGGGGGHR